MAIRNKAPLLERIAGAAKTAAKVAGEGMVLIFFLAACYAAIFLADALINAPQTETRMFHTASGDTYQRTQLDWGASPHGEPITHKE